ncbi:MAG: Rpn family recombination-promoting nuclease/putative transposase [Bacteroidota bacterium]
MANEQPHDRLIKETLSHINEAIRFFKKFLPAHISNRLDFSTLRMENATFLNENGREIYSDLVFSCNWKDTGEPVLLYLLLEHKSTPEQRPHLQIGSYLNEGYQLQAKQQREEKKNEKLIRILPILLYHGTESWEIPAFKDYFHIADPCPRLLPAWFRVNYD